MKLGRSFLSIARFAALACAAFAACALQDSVAPPASAASSVSCAPPPGVEALLARQEAKFIVIGEGHGAAQTPQLFGEIVCAAAADGKAVLVGLEQEEFARPALDAFMASPGAPEDVAQFLDAAQWREANAHAADGRKTAAMLALIARLRELRAGGRNITVTPFQRFIFGDSQTVYEEAMAGALISAAQGGAYDRVLVLVGNVHAQRATFAPNGGAAFEPMAMHLPAGATLSLNWATSGGEAWNCSPDCGPHRVYGPADDGPARIELFDAPRGGFDGVLHVGPASASAPVRD